MEMLDRLERAAMAYERLGRVTRDDEKSRAIRKDTIAELAEARRVIAGELAELDAWREAAKATDIYEYLVDALARMGTVGPKGIRQMVAYCIALKAKVQE